MEQDVHLVNSLFLKGFAQIGVQEIENFKVPRIVHL